MSDKPGLMSTYLTAATTAGWGVMTSMAMGTHLPVEIMSNPKTGLPLAFAAAAVSLGMGLSVGKAWSLFAETKTAPASAPTNPTL